MRVSAGGFYTIDGRTLRERSSVPAGPGEAQAWNGRHADLWTEAMALMHVNRRLSDEELGLWGALEREIDRTVRTLNVLEQSDRANARAAR